MHPLALAVAGILAACACAGESPPSAGGPATCGWTVDGNGAPVLVETVAAFDGGPAAHVRIIADGPQRLVAAPAGPSGRPVVVLPRRPGAAARWRDGAVETEVPGPGVWTLIAGSDPERVLHIAVTAPASGRGSRPELTFGPGVHEIDTIRLTDGDTLWIDPRAVLRARPPPAGERPVVERDWAGLPMWRPVIMADGARGVAIRGGGTLDLSALPWHARMAVGMRDCTGIVIDGLAIRDAPGWGIALFGCADVEIRRVANLSHRENSDGIDLCNVQRAVVEDCFFRTNDDAVCVKTTFPPPAQASRDILVRRITVWNGRARGLGITSETRHDIAGVRFEDCDIIRDRSAGGECAALAVIVADRGRVEDVVFSRIRIEQSADTLALLRIARDAWSTDDRRGHIAGVRFLELDLGADVPARFRIEGYDPDHRVVGTEIAGLRRAGDPAQPDVQRNGYADPPSVR